MNVSPITGALSPLRARWLSLSPRERLGLQLAAAALSALFQWRVALMPAWDRLESLTARSQAAIERWHRMQDLAAQSAAFRAVGAEPVGGLDASTREALVQALGPGATLEVQTAQLTLEFSQATPDGIRQVLAVLRSRLRASVTEAGWEVTAAGLKGRIRVQWIAA